MEKFWKNLELIRSIILTLILTELDSMSNVEFVGGQDRY